jgi:hypothetical protein
MPVNLLSAGGGTTTLTTASSASNFTVTIPASTGTMLTTANLPASLSTASGSAPSYSARAWVNFNGTGTPAIRASGNVSSITDNGTGIYTINFTNSMPDTSYCTNVTAQETAGDDDSWARVASIDVLNTSSVTVFTFDMRSVGPARYDVEGVHVSVHR